MQLVESGPLVAPRPAGNTAEVSRLPHGAVTGLRFYRVPRASGAEVLCTDHALIESKIVGHENHGRRQVRGESVEGTAHLDTTLARHLGVNPVNTRGAVGNDKPLRPNDEGLTPELTALGVSEQPRDLNEPRPVKVVAARLDGMDRQQLRALADSLRNKLKTAVVVLASSENGSISIVSAVTKDLTARIHAGKLAGTLAQAIGGKGGGRPDMAEGGGKDASSLAAALENVYLEVESKL